jgi:hypothetical protein
MAASKGGSELMTGGIQGLLQGRARAFKCGRHAALVGLVALGGCSRDSDPVAMWHAFQGGAIAAPRQAPPGADAPYPNLSSVPGRPQIEDAAARGRIAAGLVSDRANAQYATSSALAALPASAPRRPVPAADTGMSASLDAAARLETPTTAPPRTAPVGRVAAVPLAAPASSAPAAAMPDVPDSPPTPARLPGVAQTTRAAPPPVAPPPAPPAAALPPGAPVSVGFTEGSATLPDAMIPALRTLAAQRAGRQIAVAGFGDAPEADQGAQSRALPLAWERSGAIARVLQAAGVPESALSITARASGHGGVARITD